jgi:hypothetical protein
MINTIDFEKYVEALNNILGADNAYFQGDKDVDAIVELINIVKSQKAEIERLEIRLKKERRQFEALSKMYSEIRAEAIKEFAEKVKNKLWDLPTMSDEEGEYDYVCMESLEDYIDNLIKEKIGKTDV